MPNFGRFAWLILVLGAWLAGGCSSTLSQHGKATAAATSDSEAAPDPVKRLSPEALDKRAESHAYYASATCHDWNEEWDAAKEDYLQAALADPQSESMVLEVSQRLLQLRDPARALTALTNATALPGASGALLAQVGRIQFMMGKTEEAIGSNRAALKIAPRMMAPYRNLAQIYLHDRKYEEGLKVLDQAAKQTPAEAVYLIELGELYSAYLTASPGPTVKARAIESFNRAANLNPTNVFHLQVLADNLTLLGETERAGKLYQKLLQDNPELPGLHEKLADMYLRNKDHTNAAAQLKQILRQNPTHPQANFLMGTIALEEKKLPEAVDFFQKTLQLKPDFEPAYYDLALAQLSQKEPKKSIATLEQAREKFGQTFPLEFYSAMAFGQMKEYTNVIKHLNAAEIVARGSNETNRLNHLFYFQLGSAYERNQNFSEGERYLRKSLELSPDFVEALNYLGYMWAEKGTNLNEARVMIEKALKEEPKNAAFLDSLAWVYFKMDKPKEALKYMLQAVEYSEEPDATLYDHLGDIYFRLEQSEKAQEAWRKSLTVEPNPGIEKKLKPSKAGPF